MPSHRDLALLAGRLVLGGYLAAHGAQKLFGSFDGYGIEATSAGFDSLGLKPGAFFARVAGASELAGGALVVLGAGDPIGPVALAGTMAVATSTHRANGPFSAKSGYELPLTNMALALALWTTGPGSLSFDGATGFRLPRLVRRRGDRRGGDIVGSQPGHGGACLPAGRSRRPRGHGRRRTMKWTTSKPWSRRGWSRHRMAGQVVGRPTGPSGENL